jgi:hypothetical protein
MEGRGNTCERPMRRVESGTVDDTKKKKGEKKKEKRKKRIRK